MCPVSNLCLRRGSDGSRGGGGFNVRGEIITNIGGEGISNSEVLGWDDVTSGNANSSEILSQTNVI